MNIKTTLTLCCAVLTGLLQAAPKDAAAVYRSLAAPPAKAQADAALRASTYPALGVLPPDVGAFMALATFSDKAATVMSSPLVKSGDEAENSTPGPFDKPENAEMVRSFALGMDAGNAATFSTFLPVYTYMASRREGAEMAEAWSASAGEDYAETIRKARFTLSHREALAAVPKVKSATLKPIYGVITVDYKSRTKLGGLMNECIAAAKGPGAQEASVNGFKGWKYSAEALMADMDAADSVGKQVKAAAQTKSVYHLYKVQSNALIMVICENPADCKLVTDARKSVLSTDKMTFCDYAIRRKGLGIAYVSPELVNVFAAYSNTGINIMAGFGSAVFKALSKENADHITLFNSASRGAQALGNWLRSLTPGKSTKPFTLTAWKMPSGASHIRIQHDACGAAYAPGTLALARMGASSKTIFFTESTPYTPAKSFATPDLLTHAAHVYAAVETTTSEGESSAVELSQRMQATMSALKNVGKSLGKSSAWVVFNVKGSPELSYYSTYSDIKGLTKSAERLATSAGTLFGVNMKRLYKVHKGKRATSISFTLPKELSLGKPHILMTTDRIAIGTKAALNNLVLKTARGKDSFTGAVYSIRPAALAPMAGAVAAADPAAGMVAGMAGAVLGAVGDIHAVDTIRDGVRDIHILVKKGSDTPPPTMTLPGGAKQPATATDDDSDDSEDTDDSDEEEVDEEGEQTDDSEEEVEDDDTVEDEDDKPAPAGADDELEEWETDDWE